MQGCVLVGSSEKDVMSAQMLEVSLFGVGTVLGTVLRLDRGAWSVVKRLRQSTN